MNKMRKSFFKVLSKILSAIEIITKDQVYNKFNDLER